MSPPKVALVTGVGRRRGIGAAIATTLAADGWDVALSYWQPYDERIGLEHSSADPEEVAADVRALGRSAVLLPSDLEQPANAGALVDAAASELGPVSGLVLSHCESVSSGLLDTGVESFDRHYAVNVRASWLLLAALARQALPPAGARVVALTSGAGAGNLPYGAAKAALARLVVGAAHELGHLGVVANVVDPGPVDNGWMDEPTRKALVGMQPTGRLGTPGDAANLVRFLFSEQGSWVNGQLLHSNGGFPRQ